MNNQTEFEAQLKQQLTNSIAQVNSDDSSRLNQARQAALSSNNKRFTLPILSGTIVASFASLFLLYVSLPTVTQTTINDPLESIAILEQDEIELYEDLEFYEWLEMQQNG